MQSWPSGLARGVAVICVTLAGLAAIVGSGGGVDFLDCGPPICGTGGSPIGLAVVRPGHVTALVGTPVTFTAVPSNFTGALSYRWSRSPGGDIAGATGSSYTLSAANLGDDGAVFRVVVSSSSGQSAWGDGHLAVSATPGLVLEDGEFQDADWTSSPVIDPALPPPQVSDERVANGGNPDAYRRMVVQVPQGSMLVFYTSRTAGYDPASQGAIRVIDYAEDCIVLQGDDFSIESGLLIEQSGHRYRSRRSLPYGFVSCALANWSAVDNSGSLEPRDFLLYDGPACATGESCPDFSASAAPMRFGYWRIGYGMSGDTIVHGIDNWKVTVWRRWPRHAP